MIAKPQRIPRPAPRNLQGFTLVELMVAIAVALFLLGGLLTLVQQTKRTFTTQNLLSQQQDNERLAMTMITDIIQSAGYFPDPAAETNLNAFPAVGNFAQGQAIYGTPNASSAQGASIGVRFQSSGSGTPDGVINCIGKTNTSASSVRYTNTFTLVFNNAIGTWQLSCTLNSTNLSTGTTVATTYPLVNGVTNLQIFYGVKTNFATDDNTADTYKDAADMSSSDWNNVMSAQVTVTFQNLLANYSSQQPTVALTRVISVKNNAGVKT